MLKYLSCVYFQDKDSKVAFLQKAIDIVGEFILLLTCDVFYKTIAGVKR